MADNKKLENLRDKLKAIIGKSEEDKRRSQIEAVKAFLALKDANFDFKDSLDLIIPKQFVAEDGQLSDFAKWLTYKIMDFGDCESGYLAEAVYEVLWIHGAKKERNYWPLALFKGEKFGPDTMNSMATTLNKYMENKIIIPQGAQMSTLWIAKDFNEQREEHYQNEEMMGTDSETGLWKEWKNFARNVGCIGNFTLVPKGFNTFRNNKVSDYWDLSLGLLKEKSYTDKWKVCTEKDKKFWDNRDFRKYINTFFLWEYVDDDGKSIALFDRSSKRLGPPQEVKPDGGDYKYGAFRSFLDNANRLIKRRGVFMTAMLEIAVYYPDEYKKIIDYLASDKCKLKLVDDGKNGLEMASEHLRQDLSLCTEVQNKLNELEEKLKNTPE